ncbi:MAG: BlaI/MecI/CopY family transcriptional regulator [Lachnospiraceae bacterium]|nr:BlaI/MecI/CopY family transcriptional regulator [Lachnospiraceae bacterium]
MENQGLLLGEIEGSFADMIWEREPISSSELVHLAADAFHWKRTTTHNVISRLCEKGLFKRDEKGIVSALISKDDYQAQQSGRFVDIVYKGSLPMFVSGFVRTRKLTDRDIEEIVAVLKKEKDS